MMMETKQMVNELWLRALDYIDKNKKYIICLIVTTVSILLFIGVLRDFVEVNKKYNDLKEHKTTSRSKGMEYAYMEGQIDALRGDIRVKAEGDDYIYIISPWDGGTEPHYWKYSQYKDVY